MKNYTGNSGHEDLDR